jgi:nuclear transport factor 2 (NTF2) superfamily protein
MSQRPPLPPFTRDTAIQKIRLAEDAWNGRDPSRIVLAYSPDTRWRNRSEFPVGREQAQASGFAAMGTRTGPSMPTA